MITSSECDDDDDDEQVGKQSSLTEILSFPT